MVCGFFFFPFETQKQPEIMKATRNFVAGFILGALVADSSIKTLKESFILIEGGKFCFLFRETKTYDLTVNITVQL